MPLLEFSNVTFLYDGASAPLFAGLSLRFPDGWTGVVGPNGCGKSTLLALAAGELRPARGHVRAPGPVTLCPQRTDFPPGDAMEFLRSDEPRACTLRGQLCVKADWPERWSTLSQGERKRLQIGVALWREPRALALDEPTNHIDAAARALLLDTLRGFRGVGLLVSHDRTLLDSLCRQCLLIAPGRVTMRPGGYTTAMQLETAEDARRHVLRDAARREAGRLQREANQRRAVAARADRLRSKRRIDPKDHSAKAAIDRARVTGKDGVAGRKLRQMQGRVEQAESRAQEISVQRRTQMGVRVSGMRSRRPVLLRLPAGSIQLGAERRVEWPELALTNDARVALTGPNGAGKSSLLREILARLDLPPDRLVYLPQELDTDQCAAAADALRRLPPAQRGEALSHISRLGSQPSAVIETGTPSPGEARKILLAAGLAREPHLLVMDEPTNHLDLPSIECLEAALGDCSAALLLVSHDEVFLNKLTRIRWQLGPVGAERFVLRVRNDVNSE